MATISNAAENRARGRDQGKTLQSSHLLFSLVNIVQLLFALLHRVKGRSEMTKI